jgi:hypothetical protein
MSLSTLINSCEIDANTLINSKTMTGKSLFDLLVEGAWSNFNTFKASGYSKHPHGYYVSNGQDKRIGEFFEYWDDIAVGSSWQTRLESSIALIGLLQAGREGSFATVLQSFRHLDSSGGLVPLHRRTIARVFNEAIVPTTWPYIVAIRAVELFFNHLDHLGLGDLQEVTFKRSVWYNNWILRRPFCQSGLLQRMLGYMAAWDKSGVHYAANHAKGLALEITGKVNSSMNRHGRKFRKDGIIDSSIKKELSTVKVNPE